MLINMGDHPEMNVTEVANYIGVTKGAVSQTITKLEKKGFIKRYKNSTNEKEVFIELTAAGREIYKTRKEVNERSLMPLLRELEKHPDEKIAFLVNMFEWIDGYLSRSIKKMREHTDHIHE
jgi:DNA-binding MarR family transcriptional regulator